MQAIRVTRGNTGSFVSRQFLHNGIVTPLKMPRQFMRRLGRRRPRDLSRPRLHFHRGRSHHLLGLCLRLLLRAWRSRLRNPVQLRTRNARLRQMIHSSLIGEMGIPSRRSGF